MKFPGMAIAALVFAVTSTKTEAFCPTPSFVTSSSRPSAVHPIYVGGVGGSGWDNEDFLSGLGSEGVDPEEANRRYYKQKEATDARREWSMRQMQKRDGDIPPPPSVDPATPFQIMEEGGGVGRGGRTLSGGGSRLSNVMNRSKMQAQPRDDEDSNYDAPPPVPPEEDKMRAASEAAASRMGGRSGYDSVRIVKGGDGRPPPPPPPPEATFQNTADLYFAQLKADTRARQKSMIRGDKEGHQAVWANPEIKTLEDKLSVNPFLEAERATIDTSDEEKMLLDYMQEERKRVFLQDEDSEEKKRKSTGLSYRQMLEEKRKKKSATAAAVIPPPPPAAAVIPPPPPPPPQPATEAVSPPPEVAASPPPPPPPPPVSPIKIAEPPVEIAGPPEPKSDSAPVIVADEDATRAKIRTTMGLLLKHRGGPNFGRGRLKGPEWKRFDSMVEEVVTQLYEEAGSSALPTIVAAENEEQEPDATAPVVEAQPVTRAVADQEVQPVTQVVKEKQPTFVQEVVPKTVPSSSFDSKPLDDSLECVQAIVTAYRVAPPGTIGLESLRNALASAVRKCEEALGMPSSSTSATGVSTSGETIEASVQAEASVEEMVTTAPIASPTKEVEETLTPTVLSPLEGDENFLALKNVYDKIAGASGREKYGLKAMDVDEAKDLADSLASFKSILLKELEEGVSFTPSDAKPVESEPVKEIPQETRGASTYEKMLAKARAKKELGA